MISLRRLGKIQVVTDNVANYKAAGDLLMQKWKQLYWTPCAAHCIDLMLEDFEKKIQQHKETIAGDEKPAMGYIYEEMDRAKERTQSDFKGVGSCYKPIWKINDERCDELHRPLYVTGHFLNPVLHYAPEFIIDNEVLRLEKCSKIDHQLESFKEKNGLFGGE
ncbi:hypothetical protein TSUD_32390 [Trifolium subterraneum]|uniref:DUF659 domain-containing protein n=1 Tax=Trifolium subterraneum TaxID=3900 RepID=A0A2Z6MQZ0_TRISU|nr:hypothetical protein TSUD_32390 [Trifolium subterraneum]